ncbi:MAG: hypothetical protein OMM_00200 [Candidatus Magnetoglobus multicellularis str. Araruama]|uniref:Protein-glutamate methylesterase/protein-glutamine glutaminase n=1 Tax=Candidatus Magnetoglobus multicellularis str. Araruama TaxID=890399 RepID=A0A1V1PI33_9BACT|nr:MAG: hypothetical protein OMM_00200 [Candidatus Magnetoglobus multicellularis str. Araruama]
MSVTLNSNLISRKIHMTRLLIVDDCPIFRHMIRSFAEMNGDIKVIGEAVNGLDAIDMVYQLSPDILTMDINMPIMGGLDAIEHIMSSKPLPILVITSRDDAETAYQAIAKGALEVLPKANISSDNYHSFSDKVKLLSKVAVISHIRSKKKKKLLNLQLAQSKTDTQIIGIASSTGGPSALAHILSELPKHFPVPIVVAQHLSDGFLPGLISWLDRVTQLTVKCGENGETLLPGFVYIAPPEKHMIINSSRQIAYLRRDTSDIYHPSCNQLLKSIGEVYHSQSIGMILTGMGNDGLLGARTIKDQGGFIIAQDEASSAIFGMPQVVINAGYADKILSLNDMIAYLVNIFC